MTQPSDPNSKPPLNEQIADRILKVIMTGGVAGGGLGAFCSLFKDSDVPKAIASAAIGLGISYAAKMLQPIHEGNQRRLEKTGKAIDQGVDHVGDRIMATVLQGEDKYLQYQAWDCQQYKPEGVAQYDDINTLLLEDVFVPLRLDTHSLMAGFQALDMRTGLRDVRQNGGPDCPPNRIWDFWRHTAQQPHCGKW